MKIRENASWAHTSYSLQVHRLAKPLADSPITYAFRFIWLCVRLYLHSPGEGGILLGILGEVVPLGPLNLEPILVHKMSFFHTRFQTWPLRNYVIIT